MINCNKLIRYDPNGDFIRHFLPVLTDFPAKYICAPWEAPLEVQRKSGCVIGHDYPLPIVDHDIACERNMRMMKAAYGGSALQKEEEEEEDGEGGKAAAKVQGPASVKRAETK